MNETNETDSYADAVRRAIAFGGDTDLTTSVTGGIAGLRYGMYGIPDAWREQLRGKEKIDDRLVVLLIHATPRQTAWISKARSSRTDPLRIGTIDLAHGGKIGITFCPGKKQPFADTGAWNRNLDTDLDAIKAWGCDASGDADCTLGVCRPQCHRATQAGRGTWTDLASRPDSGWSCTRHPAKGVHLRGVVRGQVAGHSAPTSCSTRSRRKCGRALQRRSGAGRHRSRAVVGLSRPVTAMR
ncbi:hypothetical protein ACVWWQ_003294 [Rhodanobacter sp. TND4EL1]